MVFESVCKALLWWPSGANVVHLRQKKIGKRLMINHLPIFKSDSDGARTHDPQLRRLLL